MHQLTKNSIKGSINVITGCGSGLGKATLQWFLSRGCGPVLGIDRQFKENYESDLNLSKEQKRLVTFKRHDTFDEKVESSLEDFVSKNGIIDNLINVAGVSLAYAIWSKNGPHRLVDVQDLFKFNTVGTFNMIRLVSRYMIEDSKKSGPRRPRCIVNTSSISAAKASHGQCSYAASTNAIDSMTLAISREFSPFNIRCNTINVGYFDTPLLDLSTDHRVTKYLTDLTLCPRALGHPDQFAHLVQATIENQMLNGCCIKLDGCAEPASFGKALI